VVAGLPVRNLDGNPIACRLVMDEPTDDLDIETLGLLESLLVVCEGTVWLVSHDRGLLNDVVTSARVIEDDGLVKEHEEGYDDHCRQRLGEPASQSRPNSDVRRKKAADTSREQSRKLSCKERKEPEGMPGRIEQREKAVQDRHAAIIEQLFCRRGRDGIGGARKRLGDLERDLGAAYGRWHLLEELAG